MTGRNPHRPMVDLNRGRSSWRRRLREAIEDGLDYDGDDAVLAAIDELVLEMKIKRPERRGRPEPARTGEKIKELAAAVYRDGGIGGQKQLAYDLGVSPPRVSEWLRDERFIDELATLIAASIDDEK